MPSGENNLDDLLKGLSAENEDEELGADDDFDAGGFNNLTEEEIDRILSVKPEENEAVESETEQEYGDVLDMLEDAGDDDLQEIQDLLQKSDRNERILEEDGEEEDNPADRLLADIEGAGEDEQPEEAADKKKQRATQKKRRKEEKAAEKAAKKAARKAARGGGKKGGGKKNRKPAAEEELIDRDLLDDIVSGAGRLGREDEAPAGRPAAARTDSATDMSVAEVELEQAEGLVPDVGADFAALDMDEIDALIPDITEKRGDTGEAKKGFISKALSFLLEEEEEPENEDIQLSDENQQILDELNQEGAKGKAKKGKKGKGKKPVKDKKKAAKPKKKEKPPKKAKEKKPKEEETSSPGKRLSFKKMLPVLLLGATVGAVVFIFVNISTEYAVRQAAEEAFAQGDYKGCYLNLYGKKLSEEEEAMFGKSESILYIQIWYQEYEVLIKQGRRVEALDSLIQTVIDYQGLYEYAAGWDALAEVEPVYAEILNILAVEYAVSEEQALEIGSVESDVEYTRIVTALAEGRSYGSWGRPEPPEEPDDTPVSLPDELPEESGMEQGGFVDNQ